MEKMKIFTLRTRYFQLYNILNKIYLPCDHRRLSMTIKEIAKRAGVSVSTVSKVMNHKDSSISQETRERVLQIAKEFSYTPYSGVLSGNSKSFLIGIMLSSESGSHTLSGIFDGVQELGYMSITVRPGNQPDSELKAAEALCKHNVDAVIWYTKKDSDLSCKESFRSAGIPCVLISPPGEPGRYKIDFEELSCSAVSSLIEAGHQNIACLALSDSYCTAFINGYKKVFFNSGISLQEQLIFTKLTDSVLSKIASGAISAIAVSNYTDALELYGILKRRHYAIPRDLSLITLKSDDLSDTVFPPISYVQIPYYAFGKHIARAVIQSLEKNIEIRPFHTKARLNSQISIQPPFDSRKKHMVVIGSINIDNYLAVQELPTSGKTSVTTNVTLHPGGKAVNHAVAVSRLGVKACLIGTIGDDRDSELIYSALDHHNVDSSGIRKCQETSTGKAFIFLQPDGTSTISLLTGANASLCPEDVIRNESAFENCSFCLMQTEVPQDALIEAGRQAHRHHVKTILKPSACTHLDPELLKYVDILVPNFKELSILCPKNDFDEQTDYFLDAGISAIIITFGEEGCFLKTRERQQYFTAARFTAVDNTGAGDAFISALAVYLDKGYSLEDSIRISTYAAGFCVSREGVALAMIDQDTLESYIQKCEPGLIQ